MKILLSILIVLLFAVPVGAASVQLQWDANTETDLAGYKVYYQLKTATSWSVVSPTTNTTATVSGLNQLETYLFAVTAFNTGGVESTFSNIVEAYFLQPPSNFRVTSVTANGPTGTITVAWNAYTLHPITKYRVFLGNYSGSRNNFIFTNASTVIGTTYTASVSTAKKWFLRVVCADAVQTSWWSTVVNVNFIKSPAGAKPKVIDWRNP